MNRIEEAIDTALIELNIPAGVFYKCNDTTAQRVIKETKSAFVQGAPSVWWFSLTDVVFRKHYADGGFRHLQDHIPVNEETFWFIPEIHEERPLVYEARLSQVAMVIGECFGFDYYLVGKFFNWLIAESDADEIIVSMKMSHFSSGSDEDEMVYAAI